MPVERVVVRSDQDMPWGLVLASLRGWSGGGREDGSAAFAEADAGMAGSFAGAAEDDLISVRQEGTGFAGGESDGLRAVAGEFEETAGGGFGWPGDCAGGKDVSELEVATVAGVMGDELGRGPIEILGVGLAEQYWLEFISSHGFG